MAKDEPSNPEPFPVDCLVLAGVGLGIMLGGLKYGFGSFDNPGAGYLPFFAGCFVALFSVFSFFRSFRGRWDSLKLLWRGKQWSRGGIIAVALILYSLVLHWVGYVVSTFLLMVLLFSLVSPPGLKRIVLEASFSTAASYIIFDFWLGAQLPKGILGF